MKILSWNVNGIRSAVNKGLLDVVNAGDYDIIMLQEVKSDSVPLGFDEKYAAYLNASKRKGYSGTLTLSRVKPLSVSYGIGDSRFDGEGRVISLELEHFYVINAYFPNSQHGLTRLDYKLEFNASFEKYVQRLGKPAIMGGDFNVAHEEIDIARPKDNVNNAGFTKQERDWMTHFLGLGYVDTFRMFVKEGGHYSWWSYRFNARQKNIGWRIDYLIVSEKLRTWVKGAGILESVKGSDHAPVYLDVIPP
ncbi:MAG: exodeoxyribonuclease III [Nitrososphaerota archaeon]|jgi:exodeoxyribonuclease-3|nr:exodeoxyribonuclease III [Nitrososphaerota archaeon]MDG6931137.1 exodeoxyribonuclease III [Nitrososphaerota archaeon]